MSFLVGFATGMGTGVAMELKQVRHYLREYIAKRGITIRDGNGRRISIDQLLARGLRDVRSRHRTIRIVVAGGLTLATLLVAALALALWL